MNLVQLRRQSHHNATLLYQVCLTKNKGHALLRSGRFNAGMWRQSWVKSSKKSTCAQATVFVAFLSLELSKINGLPSSATWPWENRSAILGKEKTKDWLNVLLSLDNQATIFVDMVPALGVWLGDVFNFIPRDVWTLAAELIARFYRSSKQLYNALYPDGLPDDHELRQEFFFAKVETSLSELFDFSIPAKSKGTTREVFVTVSDDIATQRYGSHSHVHRHSLYLLIRVALLDTDWYQKMFNVQSNSFQKHLLNIKDDSCLSVWYTGLLETAYFSGHSSTLDWSLFTKLNIDGLIAISELPVNTQTPANPGLSAAAEALIRKKILKIRAVKSNIQLVGRLYFVNQNSPSAVQLALYKDVEQWYSSDGVNADWHEIKYDYLAKWHDSFQHSTPVGTSILYDRIQMLNGMSAAAQRARLIECYQTFVGAHQYSLLTRGERKLAFFDLWYLLSVGDMFEGGFSTTLLDDTIPLVFNDVSNLNESILKFIQRTYVDRHKAKEIGKVRYTQQVMLLAILVHAEKIKCHQDELAELIRDGVFEELFVLSESGNQNTEQVFNPASAQLKQYSASPIAIWMMTTERFRGARTPLVFQVIQSFLIDCATETQKFNLFWRLSLYESDQEIYKIFAKNLFFPFHVLDAQMVQYTQVNWGDLCNQLLKHEKGRRDLDRSVKSIYSSPEEVVLSYDSIWNQFLTSQVSLLDFRQVPAWSTSIWNSLISFWQVWLSNLEPNDYLELKKSEDALIHFFMNVELFLASILHEAIRNKDNRVEQVYGLVSQLRLLCIDLDKGTETYFEADLQKLRAYSPDALKRQVPYELSLMYSTVVEKLHRVMSEIVSNEKNYLEWDREIQSPFISFDKLQLKLKGKPGYWKHTLKVFEATRVEQFVSQAWIDNLLHHAEWTTNQFEPALVSFEGVFEGYPKSLQNAYAVLVQRILTQPKRLGRLYSPLLEVIQQRILSLPQSTGDSSEQEQWVLAGQEESPDSHMSLVDKSLREQGLHGLANKFTQGHSTAFSGAILRFAMNHGLSSFVAAVVSLTLLLDFGGSLLNLYEGNVVSSIMSLAAAFAFAFGYPYAAKHREMGVSVKDSVQNIIPSFIVSGVMSYGLALIWTMADGEASFGIPAVLLMLFFTTIVKAATDGAFDTDKE